MKKPQELRAEAVKHQAKAKGIYETVKTAPDGRDFTADELREYDAALTEASQLLDQAADIERREKLWAAVDAKVTSTAATMPHTDEANTRNGRHTYSVLKAIRSQIPMYAQPLDGIELEVHQELSKRKKENTTRGAQGLMIPWDLTVPVKASEARSLGITETRALDTSAGTGAIPTILDATLIDLLRARMVVVNMGATIMTDMQGLFAIPRQNAAGTAYWVAESAAPTASNQTIDQVAFSPKTAGAYTDYSRRFLEQTNQDAEAFVKKDLTAIIARAIETAAYVGTGSSNQPSGITNRTGATPPVALVSIGTNGGSPTYGTFVSMEEQVAVQNADFGKLGYITNAAVRGTLKQTLKVGSTFPIYIWDGGEYPVNGYSVGITNLIPSNLTKGTGSSLSAAIFGNWEDLVIPFWSGIDLLVDPYTNSNTGSVRVVALQDCDVNLRHNNSFACCVDMVTV